MKNKHKVIQVCERCLRASCWYGEFMCDEAVQAGTTYREVSELRALGKEHPEYWSDGKLRQVYGEVPEYTYNKAL